MKKLLSIMAISGLLISASQVHGDLVGHWPLDGNADNKVPGGADGIVTNENTGGPTDGSVWVVADDFPLGSRTVFGTGGQAPADTAYIRAGDIPQMTLENDFTWAFWSNTSPDIAANPGRFAGIVGNRYQPGPGRVDYNPRQFIKFTPTAFEWHMNGNGNDNIDFGDNPLPKGEWVHQAVVKDGANLQYYRNGQPMLSGTVTQPLDFPMPLWFGGDDAGDPTENWHGLLSDVRTYDHALTSAEVAALVPEPSGLALIVIGMLGLARARRRR